MERSLTTLAPSIALPVTEKSQVGEARREVTRLATEIGFSADDCARVGLIITELGTNLAKHARNGELLARSIANEGGVGLAIYSIDRGPGMRNIEECQGDGFSTAGSSGIGLGMLKRQSTTFQIYSLEQVGTIIAVTVTPAKLQPVAPNGFEIGLITAPAPGETACGDAVVIVRHGAAITCMMADGLGHGPNAAEASDEAVRIARKNPSMNPGDLMTAINDALKKTRGAAVAITRIDTQSRQFSFCSVGNIATSLVRYGASKTLPSGNGIVGHIMPRIENVVMPWTGQDLLVMHSDGLHTHTKTYNQPGLLVRPAPIIAGMLYGQQKRGRDDASVLVVRALEL
ncbi:MAG: SpoIIE family protein phosphatase [Rariglobus sp.]